MYRKKYLIVGNWSFIPGPKGITVYGYDEADGTLQYLSSNYEDIAAGEMCIDPINDVLYSVDERGNQEGRTGGGGYVVSYKFDRETGELSLLNKKRTLSPEPCYFALDKSGKYALVACHGDSGYATKISGNARDGYTTETVFDDVALLLYRIEDDGSIGELCDVDVIAGAKDSVPAKIPHLHCVKADPSGELYIICDKGLDRVYTYRLDRTAGKLIHLKTIEALPGTSPRYGVFHPTLPIFYHDNERQPFVTAYQYDVGSGDLKKIGDAELIIEDFEGKREAQDIVIHPNEKYMYVSFSEVNCLSVLKIKDDGSLETLQNIKSGGNFSRVLCFSTDGKMLYVGNMLSQNITVFRIGDNGLLSPTSDVYGAVRPSAMMIL